MIAPPETQIMRGAKALTASRGLVWAAMPQHWRDEHRRQAIAVLVAALNEPGNAAPAPAVSGDVVCPACKGERRLAGHLCGRCNGTAQIPRSQLREGEAAPFELGA